MSLEAIRPYFTEKLAATGCVEWLDAFAFDNIPSTLLDRSFHQFTGPVTGVQTNNNDVEVEVTVTINVFFKGFNDPRLAIEESLIKAEDIVVACVKFSEQNGTELKGVYFQSLNLSPMQDDVQDNIVRAEMIFTCRVFICLG
jgi:hypothetical protein